MSITFEISDLRVDSLVPVFVSGMAWFDFDGFSFPGCQWTDAPLSVLGSFGSALSDLTGGASEVDIYFFEGPYYLKVNRVASASDKILVRAICDRDDLEDGTVLFETIYSLKSFGFLYSKALSAAQSWAVEVDAEELSRMIAKFPVIYS